MRRTQPRSALFVGTMLGTAALSALTGGQATAAEQAQAQPNSGAAGQTQGDQATTVKEVIVTGSILQRKLSTTENPVTVITAQDLQQRGITTMADAVQTLSANGAATLPNSFTANGAFAAGASAASLRGLTTNSTLTLIDGLRTAYYPLADDGTRNFVDMNSIPDVIVEKIETLKDGASSTYGADAIAGVINIITRKTYEGATVKAEGGFTQHGGGNSSNFQALVGHGDLGRDGYNVYVGMEYEHDEALYNSQRGYPFNTADQSAWCGKSLIDGSKTCRQNSVVNGLQFDNSFEGVGTTTVPVVRPWDPVAGAFTDDYRLLNPAKGCGKLKTVTITPDQAAAGGATGIDNGPVTLCQQDLTKQYGEISPDDKRFSISLRATKKLGGDAEAYIAGTYYRNDVLSIGNPSSIRQQATPGPLGLTPYLTAGTPGLTLPEYICSQTVYLSGAACGAGNGAINPNNPFAPNEEAKILYRFGDIPATSEQLSQTFRLAVGVKGSFDLMGAWNYNLEATGSQVDLTNTSKGDLYIANLLEAVATGAYNFVDPSQNSAKIRNFIAPTNIQTSKSQLAQVQGTLSRALYELPGGPLQLGLIGAFRYESVYNPTANPDSVGCNSGNPAGMTTVQCEQVNRWFTINPFGVIGHRTSEAVAFELDAPIFKQLDVDISGRYDTYSTGQSAFSPKFGAKFTPIRQVTFRTTYSEGFRIPSFAESNALPTTGFTTNQISSLPQSVQDAFNTAHNNDKYGQSYSLGLTTSGTGGLKPETSENFTAGIVLEPTRRLSFSFDYYYIKKNNIIQANSAHLGDALTAYFSGQPIPAGYKVVPGIPDPNAPNALPTPGFVEYGFVNAGVETASGYDFGATARLDLPFDIKYTSVFDANYVLNLDLNTGGTTQHYAGTIGPYVDVSASGTPKFRANWQNTFARGPLSFTATVYYTSGYQLEAEDYGDTAGVCIKDGASFSAVNSVFLDGATPVQCKTKSFWDVDANVSYQVNKRIQVYLNVENLFDKAPPLDPTTYGGFNYNPAWANAGIYGRMFRVGVRATF